MFNAGKYNKAAEAARKAAIEFPNDPAFSMVHSFALQRMGKDAKALKIMERAASRFPNDRQFLTALGIAHSHVDDWARAEDDFRKAIACSEKAPKKDKAYLHVQLGNMLWEQNHREDALEEYRTALALDPNNKHAREAISECTNAYGEPRAPTEDFDDLYHFMNIHKQRYFRLMGYEEFQTKDEAQRVLEIIHQGWNAHIAPRSKETEAMTPDQKSALYKSVTLKWK